VQVVQAAAQQHQVAAEAASWLAQQVKGDVWSPLQQPLQATWKQLLDQRVLEQLGLDITFFLEHASWMRGAQ